MRPACASSPSCATRNEPDMPRCISSTSPDDRSASRYLARRPSPLDGLALRAASRNPSAAASADRRGAPRPRRSARPPSPAPSPRRTVSTSGSSGMINRASGRRHSVPRARALWSCPAKDYWPWSCSADETPISASGRCRLTTSRRWSTTCSTGRAPLRPDERPDVGRAAPRLEGRAGHRGQSAAVDERPFALLDVAGGTGDVAFRVARGGRRRHPRRPSRDINADMLAVGRERAVERGLDDAVDFVEANAEALPFPDR